MASYHDPELVARALAMADEPEVVDNPEGAGETEGEVLVSAATCHYCNKQFYCVHSAVRGRMVARNREVRRQKRLRVRRRAPRTAPSDPVRAVPISVAPPPEFNPVPEVLERVPMFSPSARGVGYARVCRFWANMVRRFQTQEAESQFDYNNMTFPADHPMPEAQEAQPPQHAQEAQQVQEYYDVNDENGLDLELRLGYGQESDTGVDVTLRL